MGKLSYVRLLYTFVSFHCFFAVAAIVKFPIMQPNLFFARVLEAAFEGTNFAFIVSNP